MTRFQFLLPVCLLLGVEASALDLLVTDSGRDSVWRFDARTGQGFGEIIPPGSGGLASPQGLTVGPDGRLYVTSFGTDSVLRYDLKSGAFIDEFVTEVAAGSPSCGPVDVAFDSRGDLLVLAYGCSNRGAAVARFDGESGEFVEIVVGEIGDIANYNLALVVGEGGDIFVARSFPWVRGGVFRYDAQTQDMLLRYESEFLADPSGIAFGPQSQLLVAGRESRNIVRFDLQTGDLIDVFVQDGPSGPIQPWRLAIDPENRLYVNDGESDKILVFDGISGDFLDSFGGRSDPFSNFSYLILVDPDCQESETVLCLGGGRFRVTAQWSTPERQGNARAIPHSSIGGFFWFFSEDNPELLVKVLDGCEFSGRYWILASGATDVGVTLSVVDTQTTEQRIYETSPGMEFEPILDTDAFDGCGN